jgi:hypothetical protein
MFENSLLRRTFEPKREELMEGSVAERETPQLQLLTVSVLLW